MAFDIDLRDLRYFETVAALEHVGRAAERLNRTQPAISSCLRRLEDLVGAPLFEKSGRGIRLTEAGRRLLKWARLVRLDVEGAREELGALGKGLAGQIRIGVVPTAAHFLLPKVANQLLQEAPEVRLRTVVALVASLKPLLLTGEIDLMIASERSAEGGEGLVSRLVTEDTIVVAASEHHPVFENPPTLKDLAGYRWALQPPGAPTRDWLDNVFETNHLPRPNVQVESTMLVALPALIAETGLLSFISRHNLESASSPLKEVCLRELTMTRRLVLTYRENAYLSPATQRFIELLLQKNKE